MKLFVVFALCVASAAARSYGAPQIRFRTLEPTVVREAPYAPAMRAEPLLVKEAPVYEQPAPIVRAEAYAPAVEIKKVKEFVPIVKYSMDDDAYGTYNLHVETGDGSITSETGSLKNGPEGAFNVKQGQFSYTVDGQTFTTNWIADENGYRAFGAHLPTSPPMPRDIKESLEIPRVAIADDYAAPAVRVAEPIVRVQDYSPLPAVRVAEPIVRVQDSYSPLPAVRVAEPIIRVQNNYSPLPAVRVAEPIVRVEDNYSPLPAVRVAEPIVRVQNNYAPLPAVRVAEPIVRIQDSYSPLPEIRVAEPIAPVVRVAPTHYVIRSEGY